MVTHTHTHTHGKMTQNAENEIHSSNMSFCDVCFIQTESVENSLHGKTITVNKYAHTHAYKHRETHSHVIDS